MTARFQQELEHGTANYSNFYSMAALLAIQSAVLAMAIPSVCLSVCHTLVPYPDK